MNNYARSALYYQENFFFIADNIGVEKYRDNVGYNREVENFKTSHKEETDREKSGVFLCWYPES